MPSFDATDALLYVPAPGLEVDGELIASLQEETYLLIESCVVSVEQDAPQVRDRPDGTNFLTVYDPGKLVWEVEARVAFFNGLADYHPGAALSRQGLDFANGPDYRVPFQFEGTGTLVYERPRQTIRQGTLPGISFGVRMVCGGSLDEAGFPAVATPFGPIPQQASVEVHDDAKHNLLLDYFNRTNPFGAGAFTATLYAGDPEGAGVALTSALTMAAWTALDQPDVGLITVRARNQEVLNWTDTNPTVKICTHIYILRNATKVAVIELAEPLTIPANTAVRAPVNALALTLTWPLEDWPAMDITATAGWFGLRYLLGGTRAQAMTVGGNLNVMALDEDEVALDNFAVPPDAAHWVVSGLTVTPDGVEGTALAPGGGWAVAKILVGQDNGGPAAPTLMRETHSVTFTSGNEVLLDGLPVLDLG